MRLWHQKLIPYLPRQQLLGQHRECCALRGKGWGRKHATVDYVFTHNPEKLIAYHCLIMEEMKRRGYHPDPIWFCYDYRGKELGHQYQFGWGLSSIVEHYIELSKNNILIYKEHDEDYLEECLDNLKSKGIEINI